MPDDRELYCLNCFALIPQEAERRPLCGGSIAALSAQDYREKLLHALEHPLDDVRMRAIIAIRLRGEANAALPLAECALQHPLNLEQGIEIVRALERVRQSRDARRAMEMLANGHPAHAVRIAAQRVMTRGTWMTCWLDLRVLGEEAGRGVAESGKMLPHFMRATRATAGSATGR